MSKVWRVIVSIVLIAVLFGTVCIGVGLLTGADISRILNRVDRFCREEYKVEVINYLDWLSNGGTKELFDWLTGDFAEWLLSPAS